MSYSTLLRRLKKYGLKRQGEVNEETFNDKFLKVQRRMTELFNGPCCSLGYHSIWHILEMKGLQVPRVIVQDLLKEMDPERTELCRKHCLKRRMFHNPGPICEQPLLWLINLCKGNWPAITTRYIYFKAK